VRRSGSALLRAAVVAGLLAAVAIPAALATATPSRSSNAAARANVAAGSCESLTGLQLRNTTIDSAVVAPASETTPASCRVRASVTHPPAGDDVNIDIWMPVEGWNGRFQGVGGGGYAGSNPGSLAAPVANGYAAGSTDTGHVGGAFEGDFALDPDGGLNWQLIRDNAYLGVHEMTVVGKAVTAAFYGRQARRSYWNGCSTGGRQGLSEAQRYPQDYDGILSVAPAINWSRFIPAEFWPQLVMKETGNFLPQCKFAAFQAAAIEECDRVGDGATDSVIGDPGRCRFDARSLIGQSTECGTITASDAEIVNKIIAGARSSEGDFLWYGLAPGSPFDGLANTVTSDAVTTGAPFPIALTHIGIWLLQDPAWDWKTATYEQYDQLFTQSVEQYTSVIGTDNPDLRAFKRAGGKILIWHGWADQLIFPEGTIAYYERVQDVVGGTRETEEFARLFMAPGVYHCAGGPGPQPDDPLSQVVAWVEKGRAPKTLNGVRRDAGGTSSRRGRSACIRRSRVTRAVAA